MPGYGDYRDCRDEVACERHEFYNLACLARVGNQQHHIIGLQHSEVAVLGFGGVEVYGRYARAAERCGYVHGNLPGFTHA